MSYTFFFVVPQQSSHHTRSESYDMSKVKNRNANSHFLHPVGSFFGFFVDHENVCNAKSLPKYVECPMILPLSVKYWNS